VSLLQLAPTSSAVQGNLLYSSNGIQASAATIYGSTLSAYNIAVNNTYITPNVTSFPVPPMLSNGNYGATYVLTDKTTFTAPSNLTYPFYVNVKATSNVPSIPVNVSVIPFTPIRMYSNYSYGLRGVVIYGSNAYLGSSAVNIDNNAYNSVIFRVNIYTGILDIIAGSNRQHGNVENGTTGSSIRYSVPVPCAIDPTGSILYILDTGSSILTTLTTAPPFTATVLASNFANVSYAAQMHIDPTFTTMYVAETFSHTVSRFTITGGGRSIIAGTGSSNSVDGVGTAASFNKPKGITMDASNIYVTDTFNATIRMISPNSNVTRIGGIVTTTGSIDGPLNTSRFNDPIGIIYSAANNVLFIGDTGRISRLDLSTSNYIVTTVVSGLGTNAVNSLYIQSNLLYYTTDNYLAGTTSSFGCCSIYTQAAGPTNGTIPGSNTVVQVFSNASFLLYGGSIYGTTMYVAGGRTVVYAINLLTGTIKSIAGGGAPVAGGPSNGQIGSAITYNEVYDCKINPSGTILYVADYQNALSAALSAVTLSNYSNSNVFTGAQVFTFFCLDATGTNAYFMRRYCYDFARCVLSTGNVTVIAGLAGTAAAVDGTGTAARFSTASGTTFNPNSNFVYVADTGNCAIRVVNVITSNVTTIGGVLATSGNIDGPLGTNRLLAPKAILYSAAYNMIYFSDTAAIKQLELTSGNYVITTLVSSTGTYAPNSLFVLSNTLYYVTSPQSTLNSISLTPSIPQRNPTAILYASNAQSWTLY
jgi:hypothetical protein